MREFDYVFDKGLVEGLRKHHKNPRNQQALVEAHNVVCTPVGVMAYEILENSYAALPETWPYPQIMLGAQYPLIAVYTEATTKLYKINTDYSLTLLVQIPDAIYGSPFGQFDIIDVGPYQLLTNGRVLVRRNPETGEYTIHTLLTGTPRMSTFCNFKGQIVGGGVQSSWYSCGESNVLWGNIGTEDMTPGVGNVAGFTRTTTGGSVLRVRRLGDIIMAYGDNQILGLLPQSGEHAHTFKRQELLGVGVVSRGAVGGDETVHVFVDQAGWLWKITADMKLEKLGYQEYMTQLSASKIVINRDPTEGFFYISDGQKNYVLTESGLSTSYQCVTSIAKFRGERQVLSHDTDDREFRIRTDTLDLGYRALKTIQSTEAGINGPHQVETATYFRTRKHKDWARTKWQELNWEGISTQPITVDDFQLALRASNFEGMHLDYLRVRWKATDMRSYRGVASANTVAS